MDWKKQYTEDEMIVRIWDKEEIRKLMSRRSFYIANEWRRKELDELWVRSEEYRATASFGANWGYYVGMDEIARWYVIERSEKYLDKGLSVFHPINTPYIRLAGDGKTARGLFYSIGEESYGSANGEASAYWMNEKVAVDFVKEDGEWRIWHLVVANDFTLPAGTDLDTIKIGETEIENASKEMFGSPTMTMLVHNTRYNWCDDYPPIPKEYFAFDIKESYAPEGHPVFNEKGGRWR